MRGARGGKLGETAEEEDARAGTFRKARDAREKRQQRDVAKGDAVARGRQRFEMERGAVNFQYVVQVRGELGLGVASDFDGGELPHAREEHVVVRAGIADENGATARIAQDRGGDAYSYRRAFAARRGDFAREAARASKAPA